MCLCVCVCKKETSERKREVMLKDELSLPRTLKACEAAEAKQHNLLMNRI